MNTAKRLYTVTTVHDSFPSKDTHAVGIFEDLAEALEATINNDCDIHETVYKYAVVEETSLGLYPQTFNQYWFEYNTVTEKYDPIEKPAQFGNTVNWAIG